MVVSLDKLLKRSLSTAKHIIAVDQFFADHDPDYKVMREKMSSVKGYDEFSKGLYLGRDGRQMVLYDYLVYILMSRGSIWAFPRDKREDYLKILLYSVNQLLIQESVTTSLHYPMRVELMTYMEEQGIPNFFENEDSKKTFEKAKGYNGDLSYRERTTKKLYYAVDSLLPKSVGAAIELIVYSYLIRNNLGHVIPMELTQRLLSNEGHLVAPDFMVVKKGRIFGVEVKQAFGQVPDHIFSFSSETSIPVVVAHIPDTFPLRCPVCKKWILYCDEIINNFANTSQELKQEKISCQDCICYTDCNYIAYRGKIAVGGKDCIITTTA